MRKLILFDIDGTLIHTGGAGTLSMNKAFFELFSIQDAFKNIPMAGKTDKQIMKEGLISHSLPYMDGNVDLLVKGYLQNLRVEIHNPQRKLKPGIIEVLNVLREKGAALGLLTGNLEQGALIKLEAFDLNEYFLDGAFGSDHEDRNRLLPVALEKFSKRGLSFSAGDCIVVGDTPLDVQCAKVHGARCLAVATGPYTKEQLLNTDADIVFDSLADTERCLEFIRE
ncbi:MAG: HAD family hydrolase [Thermodesulfobacteriota bacterium]